MTDPELQAMEAVRKALEGLDEAARERVLRWTADKFEVAPGQRGDVRGAASLVGSGDQDERAEFEEVGELVDAAQPATGPARALVAAYWLQEVRGQQAGWSGGELNSSLKNLGHGLANVTKTLDSLKAKRPALVMQVGKSGRSRQARKTYKLTAAGVRAVREMLANTGQGEVA
jgi:hypothetical protein